MNLQPVIERLKPVSKRPIGSVAALAALGDKPPIFFPAIYVVPDGEQATAPRRLAGIHDQQLICNFVVVLMISVGGANPVTEAAELQALIDATETLIVGWVHPDAEGEATEHRGSALLSLSPGRVEWGLRFATKRRLRRQVVTS